MKCSKCGRKVEKTFLNKVRGTYIGSGKKKKLICSECQKKPL